MRNALTAILVFSGFFASATEGAAEQRMSSAEIRKAIVGKTVSWSPNGGQSYYGTDGSYRYNGYRTDTGVYFIKDGGVCMRFANGFGRCDAWYRDGARIYIKPTSAPGSPSPNRRGTIYTAIIN
jgi:hypothetical protein